jgi:hypothetical protein
MATRHTVSPPAPASLLPGGTPTTRRPCTAAGPVRRTSALRPDRRLQPHPALCETNPIGAAYGAIPGEAARPTAAPLPCDQTDACSRSRRSAKRTQLAPPTAPSRARPPGRPRHLRPATKQTPAAAPAALRNEPNWRRMRCHPERGRQAHRGIPTGRPKRAPQPQPPMRNEPNARPALSDNKTQRPPAPTAPRPGRAAPPLPIPAAS